MGTTESILAEPSQQQQQQQQQHASSQAHAHARPSPAASVKRAKRPDVKVLKGVVLGLTNSGKHTLLQRLKGKDPFEQQQDDDAVVPENITIPYQPPATVWDRIQLHIQLNDVVLQQQQTTSHDFCVIMVNPRHDSRNVRPYLAKCVSMMIQQQQTSDDERPPLRLCVLLNFRDLQGDRYNRIHLSDLEAWTTEIFEQYSDNVVNVTFGVTSLKNCYGLSRLHQFIYQTYLLHKQHEWEQQLKEARLQLAKSRAVPTMSYEEFLNVLAEAKKRPEQEQEEPSSTIKQHETERERQRRRHDEDEKSRISQDGGRKADRRQKAPSRPIMPKKYTDPKQALEDFFAEDDDEDDVTPVTSHHARNHDDYEDDDEDDDFFYDEGGRRHQHGDVVLESSSSTDEEEEGTLRASVEPDSSNLAKVRELSIVDEESSSEDESSNAPPTDDAIENDGAEDENGWGDDDIDLDVDERDDRVDDHESDNNAKKKAEVDEHGTDSHESVDVQKEAEVDREEANAKDVEDDTASDVDGGDGWGDVDLDLDVDEEDVGMDSGMPPNHADETAADQQCPVTEENASSGATDDGEKPKDSSTDQTEASDGTTNDDHGPELASSPASVEHVARDTDDSDAPSDEDETEESKAAHDVPSENSNDDDDFIVEQTSSTARSENETRGRAPAPDESTNSETPLAENTSSKPSSPGLSAAALAAIVAAEQEAELMVQQQAANNEVQSKPPKKHKKKKDPTKKKKKKKHKSVEDAPA